MTDVKSSQSTAYTPHHRASDSTLKLEEIRDNLSQAHQHLQVSFYKMLKAAHDSSAVQFFLKIFKYFLIFFYKQLHFAAKHITAVNLCQHYRGSHSNIYFAPVRGAQYYDQRVCVAVYMQSVCLLVCPLAYLKNHVSKLDERFCMC